MNVSSYLRIPQGHSSLDFVDITTDDDTELFIDPCLIELGRDTFSQEAARTIADFADQMYADMRSSRWHYTHVFDKAHEVHETRLGYGNGHNGKGKTPQGMRDSLNGLCDLANGIPSISRIQDVSIFVQDFAEDCMSDLLANILRRMLSRFTAEQMAYYGRKPDGFHEVRAWNRFVHGWTSTQEPFWQIDGRKILLVPKWWVRKNFLFKAHQYLCAVIISRMKEEPALLGLPKVTIWKNMERDTEHWEYDKVTAYTLEHPDALAEYHDIIPRYYRRIYGCMDDDELDEAVYHRAHRTA